MSSGRCDNCGWDFDKEYKEPSAEGKPPRKTKRDQINIPIRQNGRLVKIITRCGDCYEREVFRMKKSRWSDCSSVEALHMQSLRMSERADHWSDK